MRRKKRAEAPVPRETVERAARVYSSNTDAAAALGIAAGSFVRLCRRHGIEPPSKDAGARTRNVSSVRPRTPYRSK